jgi:hypothetical protein
MRPATRGRGRGACGLRRVDRGAGLERAAAGAGVARQPPHHARQPFAHLERGRQGLAHRALGGAGCSRGSPPRRNSRPSWPRSCPCRGCSRSARAHSMISVDTGPAHAAAALSLPLVVLFGAHSQLEWLLRSPSGSPVVGVGGPPQSSRLDDVAVETVFDAWRAARGQAHTDSSARHCAVTEESRKRASGPTCGREPLRQSRMRSTYASKSPAAAASRAGPARQRAGKLPTAAS